MSAPGVGAAAEGRRGGPPRSHAGAAAAALGRRNLVLAGPPGSGKSTLGPAAARLLRRGFVDTDTAVERQAGRPVPRIFAELGEERFRELESEAIAAAAVRGGRVLAVGGGALQRPENLAALRRTGLIVGLQARPEVIFARIGGAEAGARRPLLSGPDPLQRLRDLLEARAGVYALADVQLDTSDLDRVAALRELLILCRDAAGVRRR